MANLESTEPASIELSGYLTNSEPPLDSFGSAEIEGVIPLREARECFDDGDMRVEDVKDLDHHEGEMAKAHTGNDPAEGSEDHQQHVPKEVIFLEGADGVRDNQHRVRCRDQDREEQP